MVRRLFPLVVLLAVVAGCSGYRSYQRAQVAEQHGDWDQAVLNYLELVDRNPGNLAYRAGLLRAKIKASQIHFEKAKELHTAGALERAILEYQQAVQLDPTNQYAQVEMAKARNELAESGTGRGLLTLDDLKRKAREDRPQPPILNPREKDPISLNFPKPVSVKDIYNALGKAFGVNVMFDSKLRDQQLAIELADVTAQGALEMMMRAAAHFYKVVDERTIIVAEDNPQNRRVYEDLVIQTFFLSNADPKEILTMLRSLVGAKNIAQNEQLNAIILRDTADKVKVAERILMTNDKARGEVVVDVELLQINTNKLRDLGVSLSAYQITQSIEPTPTRLSDIEFLNQGNWLLNLPAFIYDFVKNSTEAQLLANPQVRISDGEKASFHIGDRVPIPVTTFNTAQTVGGNIVPITSFQYQDIGIRLEIEPRLHHNKEVTLKLKVEVSNLSGSIAGSGGQQQPIIGTRTIESTIRLKDGETNFLAGLIRTDETNTEAGVPGLSDIPVLGRLFSKKRTENQRTDLVLTMTPHIIRTASISEEDLLPIWVGTEANITFRGGSPRVESEVEGPFDEQGDDEAERIREMIRQRIQNLPRGLREPGDEETEIDPGIDLAPSAAPGDFFQPPPGPDEGDEDDEGDESPTVSFLFIADPMAPDAAAEAGTSAALPAAPSAPPSAGEAAPAPAATATEPSVRLRLVATPKAVAPGQRFDVTLAVSAAMPVAHLPVTLRYDPTLLAIEKIVPGSFLGGAFEARILTDSSEPGRIIVGASRLGATAGVRGDGVLATLRFRALADGETTIRFVKSKALDAELVSLSPVVAEDVRVAIGRDAFVPPAAERPATPERPAERPPAP